MSGRARTAVEAAAETRRKHSAQSVRIGSHGRGVLVGPCEGWESGGESGGAEHGESARRLRWGRSGTQEEFGFAADAARGLSRLGLLRAPRPTMPREGALSRVHLVSERARGGESASNSLLQNASSTRRSFCYSASPRPSNETPSQLHRIRLPQLTFPRLFPRLPLHPPLLTSSKGLSFSPSGPDDVLHMAPWLLMFPPMLMATGVLAIAAGARAQAEGTKRGSCLILLLATVSCA
jgi:hypothetical protein